jgi:hypothetical protein
VVIMEKFISELKMEVPPPPSPLPIRPIDMNPPDQRIIFFNHRLPVSIVDIVDKARKRGATLEEIEFLTKQEFKNLKTLQNWVFDPCALNNYKNDTAFVIRPMETLLAMPCSCPPYDNDFSFEIKYFQSGNKLEMKKSHRAYHMGFTVKNKDQNIELYVEEGTSLTALLEAPEIEYGLCHISLKNFDKYCNYLHGLENNFDHAVHEEDDDDDDDDENNSDFNDSSSSGSDGGGSCCSVNIEDQKNESDEKPSVDETDKTPAAGSIKTHVSIYL